MASRSSGTFTETNLHDIFEFVDQVRELNLESKYMLCFDVTSLITNVPLVETINFICSQI